MQTKPYNLKNIFHARARPYLLCSIGGRTCACLSVKSGGHTSAVLVVTGLAGQRGRDLPVIILNERGSAVLTVLQLKGDLMLSLLPPTPTAISPLMKLDQQGEQLHATETP